MIYNFQFWFIFLSGFRNWSFRYRWIFLINSFVPRNFREILIYDIEFNAKTSFLLLSIFVGSNYSINFVNICSQAANPITNWSLTFDPNTYSFDADGSIDRAIN